MNSCEINSTLQPNSQNEGNFENFNKSKYIINVFLILLNN